MNSFEKFAACGHSADRIKKVKAALKTGDSRQFELFTATLDTNLGETKTLCDMFQENADKPKDVETIAIKAKGIFSAVGGAAIHFTELLGSIVDTAFTVLFPSVETSILGAVALGAGIADAVGTGIEAAQNLRLEKLSTKLSQLFRKFLAMATFFLTRNVKHLSGWINELHSITIGTTRAKTERCSKVVDALEFVSKEIDSSLLEATSMLEITMLSVKSCQSSPSKRFKSDSSAE